MLHRIIFRQRDIPEDEKGWIDRSLDYVENRATNLLINRAKPALERAVGEVMPRAREAAQFYAGETLSRVAWAGSQSHDPTHFARAMVNPELTQRYLSQRRDQMLRIVDLAMDPGAAAWQSMIGVKEAAFRSIDYYQRLDGGRKIAHARDALLDYGVDQAAELAFGFGVLTAAKLASRNRTKAAMDRYFPMDNFYARQMRRFVPRMLFTKPVSRLLAIPGFYVSYATFRVGTDIGRNIESLEDLREHHPAFARSLEIENRDMLAPGSHSDLVHSIGQTSINEAMSPRIPMDRELPI